LKDLGLTRIFPAKKGPGSVRWGIQKLQSYQIFVHPNCKNAIKELSQYSWAKDRHDKTLDEPDKKAGFDHLMDALRYATEDSGMQKFSFE
jgi:phage terminase large subunit